MKKRVLISDIAKALGVSVTTVSFILNDKAKEKRISDALTKRVLDYVKKVGYKPNQLAKSLRTGQTKILGLLVEDIANPFFSNVAKHIERRAYEAGYHIIYCSMDNDEHKAKELIQLFMDRQVDGFIITPSEGLEDTISNIKQNNIPLVLFDRFIPAVQTNYVVSDNRRGAYEATKHLLEGNNKRVGLISLYSNQTQMRDRLDGYMEAMDEFRMQSFIKKLHLDNPEDEAKEQIFEFVVDNKLDAVLFATNYLAVSGLKALKERKEKLPRMVAFDEHTLFKLHDPSISVVSQDIERLTGELIQTLIADIDGKLKESRQLSIPCHLIVRESSTSLQEQISLK
ncbi:LacI family transcriptional regulator [Sphingobacterium allocomposti]|jgi:LacI family transcriptional regulator|uniref:LacI family transcriptional regulator n=1 Tax=Sphingobacterium allocomposti TaxID=415956 RepID=A0A5S5DRY9_9SPHI|nr:LacI family DNA-binding transcriptional regulator [Sphingobacterium composti Yoo et al. 2007 non Ten et al. 2007]TYP98525.1 LacI family transcriptional regulator [Sphingobacterium composti Yoo et al. 2007 non Ten et al. 2007]HLS95478.1 LacI family DNA-binding transcriptional regulator [Sphingobacterium sp.]